MTAIETSYITTSQHLAETFEVDVIRDWVLDRLNGNVLNACCGPTKLHYQGDIHRNDIDNEIDADTHIDVAELAGEFQQESFDTILFDPPWSLYQANMRYDGNHVSKGDTQIDMEKLPQSVSREKTQVGHARLAKDGFDYLLAPGGTVIQLSYNGTCMPRRLQYEQVERTMFDPYGEGKTLIGSVDRKTQTKLV